MTFKVTKIHMDNAVELTALRKRLYISVITLTTSSPYSTQSKWLVAQINFSLFSKYCAIMQQASLGERSLHETLNHADDIHYRGSTSVLNMITLNDALLKKAATQWKIAIIRMWRSRSPP